MSNKGYFKGWYFKCSTGDKTIAFIPAYHYSENSKTASLQIITDDRALNIPFDTLEYREKPLYVKIGDCIFSDEEIILDFQNESLKLKGKLKLSLMTAVLFAMILWDRLSLFRLCSAGTVFTVCVIE